MGVQAWWAEWPRPVAFVFSGGGSLGAVQVGQLEALAAFGMEPDLVVGVSVGALNGAILAEKGLVDALPVLKEIWHGLTREHIFPGGLLSQALCLIQTRLNLFRQDRLGDLICRTLTARRFQDLMLPFGVLATELLANRGCLFRQGPLHPALLASSAIPGIYPPQIIDGVVYVDGGLTANVPLAAAEEMGAGAIVVLDAGNTCHRRQAPKHLADLMAAVMHTTLRQRVLVEAAVLAERLPILYLPTPCITDIGLLDFQATDQLIEQSRDLTISFLAAACPPRPGQMVGSPHFHDEA